jgi:hypothetical protein
MLLAGPTPGAIPNGLLLTVLDDRPRIRIHLVHDHVLALVGG